MRTHPAIPFQSTSSGYNVSSYVGLISVFGRHNRPPTDEFILVIKSYALLIISDDIELQWYKSYFLSLYFYDVPTHKTDVNS